MTVYKSYVYISRLLLLLSWQFCHFAVKSCWLFDFQAYLRWSNMHLTKFRFNVKPRRRAEHTYNWPCERGVPYLYFRELAALALWEKCQPASLFQLDCPLSLMSCEFTKWTNHSLRVSRPLLQNQQNVLFASNLVQPNSVMSKEVVLKSGGCLMCASLYRQQAPLQACLQQTDVWKVSNICITRFCIGLSFISAETLTAET